MKKKNVLERALSRILKHWISTCIGLLIIFFSYLVHEGKISATDWMMIFSGILGAYFTFFKKDDNKVISKPENYYGLKPGSYNDEPTEPTDLEP